MNESRLDEHLKALSKRPRPNLPTDFNATVWSKVRRLETTSRARRENWRKVLLSTFGTPQWAATGVALDFWPVGLWAESRQVSESD
jgi:hypothetical protein